MDLHIDIVGSGKDVLLLHGWGMHGGIWHQLVPELAAQLRLHIIDLPGHGYSRQSQLAFELNNLSEVFEQYLQQLAQPAAVIGWSLGGLLGLNLALRKKVTLDKLVMIASNPAFVRSTTWPHAVDAQVFEQFSHELIEDYRATLQRFIALQVRGSENEREVLRWSKQQLFARGEPAPEVLAAALQVLQHSDFVQRLDEVTIPLMLLGGNKDTLVPAMALEATAQRLPNASVVQLDKAGHAPFLSHPQLSATRIKEFLHE